MRILRFATGVLQQQSGGEEGKGESGGGQQKQAAEAKRKSPGLPDGGKRQEAGPSAPGTSRRPTAMGR